MTVLLNIVPRGKADKGGLRAVCAAAVESYTPFLGPRYGQEPVIHRALSSGAVLIEWPATAARHTRRRGTRWASATFPGVGDELLRSSGLFGQPMEMRTPVGGSYMAISGNRQEIFAWNTVPALEAVHYGEDADYFYVSNRPLAIALAMARGDVDAIETSDDYLAEALNFGFSMSGQTPFAGVTTIPTRSAVKISGGRLEVVDGPARPPAGIVQTEDPFSPGVAELEAALNSSTDRLLAALPEKTIQLRLSGGKDSRLLLGLLRNRGVQDLHAVTQGDENSEEVMVAAQLAEMTGIQHSVVRPALSVPSSVIDSFTQSLRDGQGYFLSEAIGAPYAFADPFVVGEGYASGQWPTFKGLYQRKKSIVQEDLDREWAAHNAQILTPELNEKTAQALLDWAESMPGSTPADILYAYGRDIRASRYMQASTVVVDAYSQVFFPFADSEVTAVSDALSPYLRFSHVAMFMVMRRVWNESLAVPFARGGRFRFERDGPSEKLSGPDFAQRTATPEPWPVTVLGAERMAEVPDRMLLDEPLTASARYLLDCAGWPRLEQILNPGFVALIRKLAAMETEHEALMFLRSKMRRIHTQVNLSRAILADRWLSREWLRP
ncbi:hypothetical protein LG293_04750 [Citricoccus nitrophenolicus]|uniref:Asparagine synthase (Glutamine-hydrolysing) n=1 Tax=Citricoccus muralis TaxID=169134 RepID=A0A3D9LD75_9MICC|nr:hypothetical protein [Citricoccus muralis]REE04381.1 hypothetical protein C8E99_2216 [Citricoccus muralis]